MLLEVLRNLYVTAVLMLLAGAMIGSWGEYLAAEKLCEESGEVSVDVFTAIIVIVLSVILVLAEMTLWKDLWYLPLMAAAATALFTSAMLNLVRRVKAGHPPAS